MVIVVSARSVQSCAGLSRNGWFGYLLALRIGQWPPERARRMATCSAELVWQTVAFLHQIEAALVGRAWQSLQNTPETRQEGFIRRADYRCGYLSFNFEEKKMKNVLLATTAIALTAGYAAADVSYSASAKLVIWQLYYRYELRTACIRIRLANLISLSQVQAKRWCCILSRHDN